MKKERKLERDYLTLDSSIEKHLDNEFLKVYKL